MGILLDDGFTTKGIRKSNYISFGKKQPVKVVKNDNTSQENPLKKAKTTALAVGALGSGALLLYLGTRGVNYPKEIRKIYQGKVSDIAQIVINFKEETLDIFAQQYKKFAPYVKNYLKTKLFNTAPVEKEIANAKDIKSVLQQLDTSFEQIRQLRTLKDKPHLSEADNFRSTLFEINHEAYQLASQVRNGRGFDVLDKSLMPKFKNGEHKELIEQYETKLGKMKRNTDKTLFKIQNQITDEYLHDSATKMSKAIINARTNHITSEEKLMEAAFAKVSELLNIEGTLVPLFKQGLSFKSIRQLPSIELKPRKLSVKVKDLLQQPFIQKILEKTDFTDLTRKDLQKLYAEIPSDFDLRRLNLVTDRLRLQHAILNAKGQDAREYKVAAAKLEYLSLQMKDIGTEEILKKCNIDFTKLNKEQMKAKMYYINQDVRKLGMTNLGEIEEILNYRQINPTFESALNIVKSKPKDYFM